MIGLSRSAFVDFGPVRQVLGRQLRQGTGINTGTAVIPQGVIEIRVRGKFDETERNNPDVSYAITAFVSGDNGSNWTSVGGGTNTLGPRTDKVTGLPRPARVPCLRINSSGGQSLWPGLLIKATIDVNCPAPVPVGGSFEFL